MERRSRNLEAIKFMQKFTSQEITINKSPKDLFKKISNLNNLKDILPSEVKDFESTENTCSFKIKGMPKLTLEITEKIEFSKISLTARNTETPFFLNCFIKENENHSKATLEINAKLNLMMRMMLEKPLTQLLDILSSKMQNL